jgi:hypothetical protein
MAVRGPVNHGSQEIFLICDYSNEVLKTASQDCEAHQSLLPFENAAVWTIIVPNSDQSLFPVRPQKYIPS